MYFDEQMFIFSLLVTLKNLLTITRGRTSFLFWLKDFDFFFFILVSFTESFTATVRLHMLVIILLYQLPP